jgi:hypothetical protein
LVRGKSDACTTLVIQAGTIFQHKDWVHKQNLMVIKTVKIKIGNGETVSHKINAHCMNVTCCCSSGEDMELTSFVYSGEALGVQGKIWKMFTQKITEGREANVTSKKHV